MDASARIWSLVIIRRENICKVKKVKHLLSNKIEVTFRNVVFIALI